MDSMSKCLQALPCAPSTEYSLTCLVPEASPTSEGLGLFGSSAVPGFMGDLRSMSSCSQPHSFYSQLPVKMRNSHTSLAHSTSFLLASLLFL